MKKNSFLEQTFTDHRGYLRWRDSKRLVHRYIAEKEIYSKNKKKYPFPFEEYQVHHIDKNKLNNKPENLKVLTTREHEQLHGFMRAEWGLIYLILSFVTFVVLLFNFEKIANQNNFKDFTKIIGFSTITLIGLLLTWLLVRERKGKKYL